MLETVEHRKLIEITKEIGGFLTREELLFIMKFYKIAIERMEKEDENEKG